MLIGKFSRRAKDYSCLRLVQAAFKLIMFATGVKLTVIGEENVPKDQAVLYVGNHRSYFDVVMTYARCPGLTGYIAKVEMLRYPLLRDWMKALYCLFLDRDDIKQGLKTILGCPIIPMAITNSAEIFENHIPFVRRCHVILEYGKPILPGELSKEEKKFLGAYTQQRIQEMLDKNKALL